MSNYSLNPHHNLEIILTKAMQDAKAHRCNYNVIIHNPNQKGEFDRETGSTYEYVADSYFDKPRPNTKILHRTDDLIPKEEFDKIVEPFNLKNYTFSKPNRYGK